jgi:hypothetical protein
MTATAPLLATPTSLTIDEQALYRTWQERVLRVRNGASDALPDGVTLGTLAVMGLSGDEQIAYPVLAMPSALERSALPAAAAALDLPADVVFAGELAIRIALVAARRGPIIAGSPAAGDMRHITPGEVTKHRTTFVLIPRVGG